MLDYFLAGHSFVNSPGSIIIFKKGVFCKIWEEMLGLNFKHVDVVSTMFMYFVADFN